MKRLVPLLAVGLAGCVIHSIGPFYSEKSQTLPKELLGRWSLRQSYGSDVSTNGIQPWVLSIENDKQITLLAYDEQNVSATFGVWFFKLGDTMFMDFMPGKVGDETTLNEYWQFAVHPVHSVCKVTADSDRLHLIALDYSWVKKGLTAKTLSLPYLGKLDDLFLVTASPVQWENFLRENAGNTNAFPEQRAFILKRLPDAKP